MAYQADNEEDLNDPNKQNKNADPSGSKSLGAESGIIEGQQKPNAPDEKGSGQYTNLQNYLDANQSNNFGTQFSDRVGQSVTDANNAQSTANDTFKSASDAGTVRENKDILNSAVNSPESIVNDPDQLSEFRKEQNASYGGPAQFSGSEYYQPAQTATQGAVTDTNNSKSIAGQQELLDKYYGTGAGNYQYTGGQKNLDQLLIGTDPNARTGLAGHQQDAQNSQSNFSQLEGALNQYGQANAATTAQTASDVNNQTTAAGKAYQDQLQQSTQAQIQKQQADVQRLNAALAQRDFSQITPEEAASLGVNPNNSLYGYKGNLVDPNTNYNEQTLLSPDQVNKMNAFNTLNNQPSQFQGPLTSSEYGKPEYTSDTAAISQQQAAQQKAYEDSIANTFYSPSSSANGGWGSAQTAQNLGANGNFFNINDPQLLQWLQMQRDEFPKDSAMRQAQLDAISQKQRDLKNQYGLNDYFKGYGALQGALNG